MDKFRYCSVQPKGMRTIYTYISEEDILFRLGKALVNGEAASPDVFTGHRLLLLALSGFYERRKTEPFVGGLIEAAKEQIAKAEEILDRETL